MVAILCCYFISSSSVCSSCLLCRRLNEEKSLAQQSSLHFLIPYFLLLRTLFHWVASAFEGPFLALFDFVLVQDFLFHSSKDPSHSGPVFSILSSLPYLPPLGLSFISSLDHPVFHPCALRPSHIHYQLRDFFVLHPTLRSFHSSSFKQVIQMLLIFPLFYLLVNFLLLFILN